MPDNEARTLLREILADPALPVGTLLADTAGHPGVDGRRLTALREAHDHIISRRLAGAAHTASAATSLRTELELVDPALATTLYWHTVLIPGLAALPPSRARNAVLGDVARGELLTWAVDVPRWTWQSGTAPTAQAPSGRVDGHLVVDDFPGLYDAIMLWHSVSRSIIVIPTHRSGLTWEPQVADPVTRAGRWSVRLDRVSVHADELIALDPRDLAVWPEGLIT